MPLPRPQRGRPKGSGIDDRARLRDIAALIAAQPALKPTTAIRMLGENDPSVIRRLRDKFHAMQKQSAGDIRRDIATTHAAIGGARRVVDRAGGDTIRRESTAEREMVAVGSLEAHSTPQTLATSSSRLLAESFHRKDERADLPEPTSSAELAPYNAFVGLTIKATISAIEHQMLMCEQALRLPPVASLLRSQMALSDALMSIACAAMRARQALTVH